MFRRYKNKKIYRNFKIAYVLSIIYSVLIAIGILVNAINFIIAKEDWSTVPSPRTAVMGLVAYSFQVMLLHKEVTLAEKNEVEPLKYGKETKNYNDFNTILGWVILIFFLNSLVLDFEDFFVELVKSIVGYLLGCVLSLTPSSFLIRNLILIKREWKKNPPEFLRQEEEKKNKEKTQRELDKKIDQSSNLFAKCGIKFFVKYYYQIRDLPLKDIEIEENYGAIERWERLSAARKIIDLNLTEIGLKKVLKDYKDILPFEELQKIKSILDTTDKKMEQVKSVERKTDEGKYVATDEKSKIEQCSDLIADCGIKFFIKYYFKIKNLPLKDVEIVESYSESEKEERLLAAKKVIDLNLAYIAAREILNDYEEVLSTEEKQTLKSIMAEQFNNHRGIR